MNCAVRVVWNMEKKNCWNIKRYYWQKTDFQNDLIKALYNSNVSWFSFSGLFSDLFVKKFPTDAENKMYKDEEISNIEKLSKLTNPIIDIKLLEEKIYLTEKENKESSA